MSYLFCTQYTDTYGCISPVSKDLLGVGVCYLSCHNSEVVHLQDLASDEEEDTNGCQVDDPGQ